MKARIILVQVDQALHQRIDNRPGAAGHGGFARRCGQQRLAFSDMGVGDLVGQRLLVGEVLIERADGHARPCGDGVGVETGPSLLGQNPSPGLHNGGDSRP